MARWGWRLAGLVLAVGSHAGTARAAGESFKWCVDSAGGTATCNGTSAATACDNANAFSTIGEAISAALFAPDITPGTRPSYQEICVSTGGLHTEDLSVGGGSEEFGPALHLIFDRETAPTWCPGGVADSAVRLTEGDAQFSATLTNLWWDEGLCPAVGQGPLISGDDLTLNLNNVRALGGTGPFLVHEGGGSIWLHKVRVEGRSGAAVLSDAPVFVGDSEFSSNSPPSPSPLIMVGAGALNLDRTAIFGNIVRGGTSLVASQGGLYRDALFAANVMIGGGSLVLVDRPTGESGGRLSFRSTVVSRNIVLSSGSAIAVVPATGRTPAPSHESRLCLPEASDNLTFRERTPPGWTGTLSDAPLLLLDGPAAFSSFALEILGSMVVRNVLGPGSSILRSNSIGAGVEILLLHNVFDLTGQSLVDLAPSSTTDRLSSARNLVLGSARAGALPGLMRYELTMDAVSDPEELWTVGLPQASGIRGPFRVDPTLTASDAFVPVDEVEELDDCSRAQLLCPEIECPLVGVPPQELFCALDVGAEYISDRQELSLSWVWESEYFEQRPPGDPYNMEGPQGWVCDARTGPFDRFGDAGDGDGFSTLLDCDNEDASAVPRLPGEDGVSGDRCWDVGDDCYACPMGSELIDPSRADDDDCASSTDDDDSGSADYDRGSERPVVAPGCVLARGCGTPLPALALLLWFTPLSLRRHRAASSAAPAR